LGELPEGAIGIDFDPAGLLLYGHDPVEAMNQLSASILHFRARDAVRDRDMPGGGTEVQLGRGSVDTPALLAGLEEHAYSGYVTVERHDDQGRSAAHCAQAMEYLDNLFR
jgi:sugar phosphate isomerase/epimerase